jgi:hypothetical protein
MHTFTPKKVKFYIRFIRILSENQYSLFFPGGFFFETWGDQEPVELWILMVEGSRNKLIGTETVSLIGSGNWNLKQMNQLDPIGQTDLKQVGCFNGLV